MNDLTGLLEFTRRHPNFRPLVIRGERGLSTPERAEIPAMTWQRLLLAGPTGVLTTGEKTMRAVGEDGAHANGQRSAKTTLPRRSGATGQ